MSTESFYKEKLYVIFLSVIIKQTNRFDNSADNLVLDSRKVAE